MADDIEDIKVRVLTALNCGGSPADVAQEFGLPYRFVHELAKQQRRFPQPKLPEAVGGKILHTVAVPERWCERAERANDAERRAASKKLTDELLKRHGLTPPRAPIIVPDSAPAGASSRGKKMRRRVKP